MALDVSALLANRQPPAPTFTPQQAPVVQVPIAPTAATQAAAGRGGTFGDAVNDHVQNLFNRLGVPGAVQDTKDRFNAGDYAGAAGAGLGVAGRSLAGTALTALAPIGAAEAAVAHGVGSFLGGLTGSKAAAVQGAAAAPVASQAATATSPAVAAPAAAATAPAATAASPAQDPVSAAIGRMPAAKVNALLGALHPYATSTPQRDLSDLNHFQFAQDLMRIDPSAGAAQRGVAVNAALENLKKSQEALYGNTLANQSIYNNNGLPQGQ